MLKITSRIVTEIFNHIVHHTFKCRVLFNGGFYFIYSINNSGMISVAEFHRLPHR